MQKNKISDRKAQWFAPIIRCFAIHFKGIVVSTASNFTM